MNHAKKLFAAAAALLCAPAASFATGTWTPLIAAEDFTGIKTDMLTTSSGIILLFLIILGLALLLRVFMK